MKPIAVLKADQDNQSEIPGTLPRLSPAVRPAAGVSSEWIFPRFPHSEIDSKLLALSKPLEGPSPSFPPLVRDAGELSALFERAIELEIFPLVYSRSHGLARQALPAESWGAWQSRFRQQVARSLYLHATQQRLLDELAREGVRAVPLKGTWLAAWAYGDPSLRSVCDLDFYVSPHEFPASLRVLERLGYRLREPVEVDPERLVRGGDVYRSWCLLASATEPATPPLDLRWRILPVDVDSHLVWAEKEWGRAWLLPPELTVAYLCFHASLHRWGGLKWLVDLLHVLACCREELSSERLAACLNQMGLARIAFVTQQALASYFGTGFPARLSQSLEAARPSLPPAWVAENPFRAAPVATGLRMHLLRCLLRERWRDQVGYALGLLRPGASEFSQVRLPPGLGFGYWLLRWLQPLRRLHSRWRADR